MTSYNNTTPIDTATVERCIELLRGTGEYGRSTKRISDFEEPHQVETWTFTTHPIDLLRSLIVPEPTEESEAEKLVSEWLGGGTVDGDEDYVRLVQFILDKQKRDGEAMLANAMENLNAATLIRSSAVTGTMKASPDDIKAINEALRYCEPKPQYVYGPWIEWHGGECPVPGDWIVEYKLRNGFQSPFLNPCKGVKLDWEHPTFRHLGDSCDITHYRVRFELNRWYGWTGGPCPVGDDVLIAYHTSNGCAGGNARGSDLYWTHPSNGADITRFKITSSGETK